MLNILSRLRATLTQETVKIMKITPNNQIFAVNPDMKSIMEYLTFMRLNVGRIIVCTRRWQPNIYMKFSKILI
jgi:hypothetical protein